jgi:hypothetical protein
MQDVIHDASVHNECLFWIWSKRKLQEW